MAKRLLTSVLLGTVVCGVFFYLGYFVVLIGAAIAGPLNPANAPGVQAWLRHLLLPASLALGAAAAIVAFLRLGRREPESKTTPGNVLHFR